MHHYIVATKGKIVREVFLCEASATKAKNLLKAKLKQGESVYVELSDQSYDNKRSKK